MVIESVTVRGFRCILGERLDCRALTVLVGPNGSGKSAFLRALELFYSPSPKMDVEDYYDQDTSQEAVVAITFRDLSSEARELFSSYMDEETLTVERVFVWDEGRLSTKFHGARLQHAAFAPVREGLTVRDRGATARSAYNLLREKPEYSSLPPWSRLDAVEPNLKDWELANPGRCTRQRDDGQFFGFTEVARGYLGRFTHLLSIPAVRDASADAAEGRGSTLTRLMDLVVRSILAQKDAYMRLIAETQKQYEEIMSPENLEELRGLANRLTRTLTVFVPDTRVELLWQPLDQLNIPLPTADVKLVEDGYSSAVARTGHGLQRAFIVTMLQQLARAQELAHAAPGAEAGGADGEGSMPDLVLIIEEPELYQHPNRQRHFARVLLQLASGEIPGVAKRTQVIYGTHSPLFVGIDRFDEIRLLRKIQENPGRPKVTRIVSTSLEQAAQTLADAYAPPRPAGLRGNLSARLQAIMTPWMNEGFFADVLVLVEGEDDRAAILGVAEAVGHDFEGSGIAVIPCGGKSSLDRPYVIFSQLGLPVYVIWDSDCGQGATRGSCGECGRPLDKKADPEENRRLLRLLGCPQEDWPQAVTDRFACFRENLETTLEAEIGKELFEDLLRQCQDDLGISKRKHAIKNPRVLRDMVTNALSRGERCKTLEAIVNKIVALKKSGGSV